MKRTNGFYAILCLHAVFGLFSIVSRPYAVDFSNISESNQIPHNHWSLLLKSTSPGFTTALIEDLNLNGQIDLYSAMFDGHLYHHNSLSNKHSPESTRLVTSYNDEVFISSPLEVHSHEHGNKILLVSTQGSIVVCNQGGDRLVSFDIPSVYLYDSIFDASLPINDTNVLSKYIHWEHAVKKSSALRLDPLIVVSPLSLPTSPDYAKTRKSSPTIVFSVNFVSSFGSRRNLTLSGLLTVSLDVLLSPNPPPAQLYYIPTNANHLKFDPLMLSNDTCPGFIIASPTIAADLVAINNDQLIQPDYSLLVATTNNFLFRVGLGPQSRLTSNSFELSGGAFTHSCIALDCPVTSNRSSLCCLMLTDRASLHLIDVAWSTNQSQRLIWSYQPLPSSSQSGEQEQTSQLVLVPVSSPSTFVAVFAQPNGIVHAVDARSGRSLPGFPIKLTVSSAAKLRTVYLPPGPGIPYIDASSQSWVLFMDRLGRLFHVQIPSGKLLLDESGCNSPLCSSPGANRLHNVSLAPQPFVYRDDDEPISRLGLIVFSNLGVHSVKFHQPRLTYKAPVPYQNITELHSITAILPPLTSSFTLDGQQPTDILTTHTADPVWIHFTLIDCLADSPDDSVQYWVKLIDEYDSSLTPWKLISTRLDAVCPIDNAPAATTTTTNHSFQLEPTSCCFVGHIRLVALQARTGRLIRSSWYPSSQYYAASVLFKSRTQWPRLLACLAYLPAIYLALLLVLTQYISSGRICWLTKEARLDKPV